MPTPHRQRLASIATLLAATMILTLACRDTPTAPRAQSVKLARVTSVQNRRAQETLNALIDSAYLVEFKGPEVTRAIAKTHGLRAYHLSGSRERLMAVVPAPGDLAKLRADPRVADIYPMPHVRATSVNPASAWQLDRIDQVSPVLDGLYHSFAHGTGTTIYVMDGGVDTSRTDLFGTRAVGYFDAATIWDSLSLDSPGPSTRSGIDRCGHGTIVAAMAGGLGYGPADNATINSVRVGGLTCKDADPLQPVMSFWAMVAALRYLGTNGTPGVLNMSLDVSVDTSLSVD